MGNVMGLRLGEEIILSGALVTYFPKKSNDKKSDVDFGVSCVCWCS